LERKKEVEWEEIVSKRIGTKGFKNAQRRGCQKPWPPKNWKPLNWEGKFGRKRRKPREPSGLRWP